MRWGMIGRLGDFESYLDDKPDLIEIHLTWRELVNPKKIVNKFNQELVVHAPEYFKDHLVDFTSEDKNIISLSLDMLYQVVELTKKISNNFIIKNSRGPRIVLHPGGHSFDSIYNLNKKRKYYNLLKNLKKINFDGVQLLLENMPPYPWYYGGEYKQNIFKDHNEIYNFCNDNNFKICYDVSHAQLYCNDKKLSLNKFTNKIKNITSYLHLSDAAGLNGEGMQIGKGDVNFKKIIETFSALNPGFVPEIWQGHLNNGEGFKLGLEKLSKIIRKVSTKKKCAH